MTRVVLDSGLSISKELLLFEPGLEGHLNSSHGFGMSFPIEWGC